MELGFVLLRALGGIILLLWALKSVRSAFEAHFLTHLPNLSATAGVRPAGTFLTAICVAFTIQSAASTVALGVTLVERKLLTLSSGLLIALGAEVGSAAAARFLANYAGIIAPVLLIAGVVVPRTLKGVHGEVIGRLAIGLAVVLLALGLIATATASIAGTSAAAVLWTWLADNMAAAIVVGLLLGWASHSGIAAALIVAATAGTGALTETAALGLILGTNLGAGLIPFGLCRDLSQTGHILLVGNMAFRVIGVLIAVVASSVLAPHIHLSGSPGGQVVLTAHFLFNLGVALLFAPLAGRCSSVLRSITSPSQSFNRTGRPEQT